MPASAVSSSLLAPQRSNGILTRLTSAESEIRLKALREVKNHIIGNRTKKLLFLKLGAVPAVAAALRDTPAGSSSLLIQSAAALGSFACGFDAGVRAILDTGAFPLLLRLLSHSDEKVVDAGARALKMIYQSKWAPKFDFFKDKNMEFLLSLLDSPNENVRGLGASIITHSCVRSSEQKALCDAGVLKRLSNLLDGSLSQRDASLESLATVIKNNPEVVSVLLAPETGRFLSTLIQLTKDRYPRTRLFASLCLIIIGKISACRLQDAGISTNLIMILLELLDDPGEVGDEAPFALSQFVADNEELQRLAFGVNSVDKLCEHLKKGPLTAKRLQGILLALGDLCSKLESCRSSLLSLQVTNFITAALTHEIAEVRFAACICLRSASRSVKNLNADYFMNGTVVIPLVQLLHDPSTPVQVQALGVISNVVVDFRIRKSIFIEGGGVKRLVQLSKSTDSSVRLNAVWALRNLIFLADNRCKEGVFLELTASSIASLICDADSSVQEQALFLVCNLVGGNISSVDYVFVEDGKILCAVGRLLQSASKVEVKIQGMYVLSNVASGNEFHKESVMQQLFPEGGNNSQSVMLECLQSDNSRLRTAAVWAVINLTFSSSPGAYGRVTKLRTAGVISHIKNMANDPCLDAKLRVRTALGQFMNFGDGSM